MKFEEGACAIGLYRMERIDMLAAYGVPMDLIALRVGLPVEVVEAYLYGDEGDD